ncbi:unnamed protein product [Closterium sp. NIES-54]
MGAAHWGQRPRHPCNPGVVCGAVWCCHPACNAVQSAPAGRMTRQHAIAWELLTGASGLVILASQVLYAVQSDQQHYSGPGSRQHTAVRGGVHASQAAAHRLPLLSPVPSLLVCSHTQTNSMTAGLGATNIALYAGVYTTLKQLHTPPLSRFPPPSYACVCAQTNSMTAGLGAANIAVYAGMYAPLKQLHIAPSLSPLPARVCACMHAYTDQQHDSGPGSRQHSAVRGGVHASQAAAHRQHMGWCCRRCHPASYGVRTWRHGDDRDAVNGGAVGDNHDSDVMGMAVKRVMARWGRVGKWQDRTWGLVYAPSPLLPFPHPSPPCVLQVGGGEWGVGCGGSSAGRSAVPVADATLPCSRMAVPQGLCCWGTPHPSHPSTFSLHTSFPLLNPTSSPPSLTVGCTTAPFLWENVLLTGAFTAAAVPFYRNPSSASARQLFRASLLFLPALMAAMLLHRLPHQPLPTHALSPAPAPALTLVPLPSHAPAVMAGAGESRVGGAAAGEQGGREEVGRKAWGETGARRAWEEAAESGERGEGRRRVSLPPVAYYSAAPFPFLPVPHYA